jgi:hydrogenase-4 membrane subunit HyfE
MEASALARQATVGARGDPARDIRDVRAGRAVWGMLALRPVLAIVLQSIVALLFVVGGNADPWRAAADWWLGWFALVSVINLILLRWLLHREHRRLRDLYRIDRLKRGADLRWVAIALAVAAPVAILPNLFVGQALWGSAEPGAELSFRAIPVVAAVVILGVFPIVHAAAELPTYFGYVMPRLAATHGWRWRALLVAALVLSTQHVFLPLLFDWRFIAWRALMFLPFALWLGFAIQRRPSTLPYLVVAHGVLDLSLPVYILVASL